MKHCLRNLTLSIAFLVVGTYVAIADNGDLPDDSGIAEALLTAEEVGDSVKRGVVISGFFDLEFNKLDTSDSTMFPLIVNGATFSNSHVNVYFDSQVSPSLRFFSEVRFLHQPSVVFTEESLADRFQGSLLIERAWVDWNYRNQLNVRCGKFLTPYGVWNTEHGSPILISTRTPLLLRKQIFPESMTGVDVYGIIFPMDFEISYHAWIGNGKGQRPATQDLDDHKSVGGRVAVKIPTDQDIEVGVSGYNGHTHEAEFIPNEAQLANIRKVFMSEGNMATLMGLIGGGLTARAEPMQGYADRALGFDLNAEAFNFQIQGELVINSVKPLAGRDASFRKFKERGGYGQLSYGIWTRAGKITPFVRADFFDPHDQIDLELGELNIYTFGVNYKPRAGVVLKAEYHRHDFEEDGRDFPMFASSLSVSF